MKRIKRYTLLVIVMMIGYISYSQTDSTSVPPYCLKPPSTVYKNIETDTTIFIDTTLIDTMSNSYYDIDWAKEFAELDNKLDSMDITINELIIYEIENYNDTINKNKYISWKIRKQNYQLRK